MGRGAAHVQRRGDAADGGCRLVTEGRRSAGGEASASWAAARRRMTALLRGGEGGGEGGGGGVHYRRDADGTVRCGLPRLLPVPCRITLFRDVVRAPPSLL